MGQETINDDLEIAGIFKGLNLYKVKLWCWQTQNKEKERIVHFCTVSKVDQIKNRIYLRACTKYGFRFDEKAPLFIFSKEREVACKVPIRDYGHDQLVIDIPKALSLMTADFIDKLELVEREDEMANSHKRSNPRKLAGATKRVGIIRYAGQQTTIVDQYRLYDISKGGMGIEVDDPAEFVLGDLVAVDSIDGKPTSKERKGRVVSIKQVDDDHCFKVGIKFD